MLPLPESGIAASRTVHNCDLHVFCDWVEGSLLFKNETRISRTAIVDILTETDIYDDQSFANNWLDDVWTELERRKNLLGAATPFDVESRVVKLLHKWDRSPAYAFCLMVSLHQSSTGWRPAYNKAQRARHFAKQGELFERISEESLRAAGWKTHRTGWSSTNSNRLPAVVSDIAHKIGEPRHPQWATNVSPYANEAGLDIVFYHHFVDGRGGFPIYLTQCAAGADWDTKLHTPSLSVWRKLIDFAASPHKAFALPNSLDAEKHRRVTVQVDGVVLDRYRLHDTARSATWCTTSLANDLKKFLRPLITKLPNYG